MGARVILPVCLHSQGLAKMWPAELCNETHPHQYMNVRHMEATSFSVYNDIFIGAVWNIAFWDICVFQWATLL